jgi:GR25 family glycosyltransferase involved in LPS biosynthesis
MESLQLDKLPTYCINLERRIDRWELIQSQPGFKEFKSIERYIGVDGKLIDIKEDDRVSFLTKRNILLNTRRSHEQLSTAGGVGCYLSHIHLWQKFLRESSAPVALIFEDDIQLPVGVAHTLQSFFDKSPILADPMQWDFCILSPSKTYSIIGESFYGSSDLFRMERFVCMAAYMITRRGVERVLPHLLPIESHIDGFLTVGSSLRMIDVVGPKERIIMYNISKSDINDPNKCVICDVKTNFEDEHVLIPKTTYWRYQAEEALLLGAVAYGIYMAWSKRK